MVKTFYMCFFFEITCQTLLPTITLFQNPSSWQDPFWVFGKDRCLKDDFQAAKTEALKCAEEFLADIKKDVD